MAVGIEVDNGRAYFRDLETGETFVRSIKFEGEQSAWKDASFYVRHPKFVYSNNTIYAFGDNKQGVLYKITLEDLYKKKSMSVFKDFSAFDKLWNDGGEYLNPFEGFNNLVSRFNDQIDFSAEGSKLLLKRTSSKGRVFGVWDLNTGKWLHVSAVVPEKPKDMKDLKYHYELSPDGHYVLSRISVDDPIHKANFYAKNFLNYEDPGYNIDANLPIFIIDLHTGKARRVKYPEGMVRELNISTDVKLGVGGTLIWFTHKGERIGTNTETGEVVHRFAHNFHTNSKEKFFALSADETVVFLKKESQDTDKPEVLIARGLRTKDYPLIESFELPTDDVSGDVHITESGNFLLQGDSIYKLLDSQPTD